MISIPKKEDLTVEFKSDKKRMPDNDIVEAIVALANTKGGCLYIGVEDNGEISGLNEEHQNIISLGALIANKTVPPQAVRIELLDEKPSVLKIEVSMSRTTVATSSGKILRRRLKADGSPENVPLFPHEITSRLAELSLLDSSAQPISNAKYSDLDPLERERLRSLIALNRGEAALLELSDEEFDKALRLVTGVEEKLVPTITGLLLIGKSESIEKFIPTAEVTFQVLVGTDVKINDSFIKPILAAFERIEEYMSAWNPEKEMEIGLVRLSIPEFDKRAFREALVNAFCHRDYSVLSRIRFLIDDDGLTINSPGGFIEGVTIENLLTAEPHGRNPSLADALKRIGLAERTGRGIDRIFEGSLIYGRPLPDYSASDSKNVKLFIQRANPDKIFTKMISDVQNKMGRGLPINSLLILLMLKQERRADLKRLAKELHLTEVRLKGSIERLIETGLVEAIGSGRGRAYMLSSKVYKVGDNSIGYVRQNDIERIRHEELTLQLAKKQGYVTRKNVTELLHVSEPQAYRLLAELAQKGKLELSGKGRYSKYLIQK